MAMASTWDCLAAGLRILIVASPACFKTLNGMAIELEHEATMCNLVEDALRLIDEEKRFDLVMCDDSVADMEDEFVNRVHSLQKDLPVVLMTDEEDEDRLVRGVKNGACDYLVKPIRLDDLRFIGKRVVQANIQEKQEVILNSEIEDDKSCNEADEVHPASTIKKKNKRVAWNSDRRERFVVSVEQLGGLEKAKPKKILELMGDPSLTRNNVASYLQKYMVKKKAKGLKISCGEVVPYTGLQQNLDDDDVAPAGIHEGGSVSGVMPMPVLPLMSMQQQQQQGEGENAAVFPAGFVNNNHSMGINSHHQQLEDAAVMRAHIESTSRPHHNMTLSGGAGAPPSHLMPQYYLQSGGHNPAGHSGSAYQNTTHDSHELQLSHNLGHVGGSADQNTTDNFMDQSLGSMEWDLDRLLSSPASYNCNLETLLSAVPAESADEMNGYLYADMYLPNLIDPPPHNQDQNHHFAAGAQPPPQRLHQDQNAAGAQPANYHDSQNFRNQL